MLIPQERLLRGEEALKLFDLASQPNIEVIFDPDALEAEGKTPAEINDAWVEMRKGYVGEDGNSHIRIGGSDQAQIVGLSPFATALDLFNVKTHREESNMDLDDPANWFRLEFGHSTEELVALCYLVKHPNDKILIDKRTFTRTDKPWLIFDVDGILIKEDGSVGIFEAKTTSYNNKNAWQERPPEYYQVQCQHYMGGLGLDFSVIGAVWGNNFASDYIDYEIEADPDYIDWLFDESELFAYNTEHDIEPPISSTEKNAEKAISSLLKSMDISEKSKKIGKVTEFGGKLQMLLELSNDKKKREDEVKLIDKQIGVLTTDVIQQMKSDDVSSYYTEVADGTLNVSIETKTQRVITPEAIMEIKERYPDVAKDIVKESISLKDFDKSVLKGMPFVTKVTKPSNKLKLRIKR